MGPTKLQSNRREYKYLVSEKTARQIKDYVLKYLGPDPYTRLDNDAGYAVHSLYLDSPEFVLCRATMNGLKNRYKLRIRFYDEVPDHPVYFEIKRRVNEVILKQRAAVRRSSLAKLLTGGQPSESDLQQLDTDNYKALCTFCSLRDEIAATPTAFTSYLRQGFEPIDSNVVRVTLDRQLRAGRFLGWLSAADVQTWPQPHVNGVVLELKFTDRFPDWTQALVECFDLSRTSVPKYVLCMEALKLLSMPWLSRL
jgi:hypothetical protein